jgi:hypothetical protein
MRPQPTTQVRVNNNRGFFLFGVITQERGSPIENKSVIRDRERGRGKGQRRISRRKGLRSRRRGGRRRKGRR